MSWKASERLMDTIRHYARFPATGVSLRQMVQFGEKPSVGTFLLALSPLGALRPFTGALTLVFPQELYSEPPNSSPRSYPFASPTVCKSWTSFQMVSARCPR